MMKCQVINEKHHLYTLLRFRHHYYCGLVTSHKRSETKLSIDFGKAAQMTRISSRCVLGYSYCILCGGGFSQEIYTALHGGWYEGETVQTTAPHNVESDAIQLPDEYRAVDVPLSFVHSSSPFFLSVQIKN
jgi:hypothetical protein